MEIFETKLPGIGVRYEFTTEAGDRAGVVIRRDGTRDIVVYDRADVDAWILHFGAAWRIDYPPPPGEVLPQSLRCGRNGPG